MGGKNFGCTDGSTKMWTDAGCRGVFTCNGASGIKCDHKGGDRYECECSSGNTNEVWLRRLSDGDFAVAMPNLGAEAANITFCLDALKWPHGDSAKARNIWAKKDVGIITKSFTET